MGNTWDLSSVISSHKLILLPYNKYISISFHIENSCMGKFTTLKRQATGPTTVVQVFRTSLIPAIKQQEKSL
jgi:hypothetical protein